MRSLVVALQLAKPTPMADRGFEIPSAELKVLVTIWKLFCDNFYC